MRSSGLRLVAAFCWSLALAACSGDSNRASDEVIHLDPRLADGRSPGAALADLRTVSAEWSSKGAVSDLQPWRPVDGELAPRSVGARGLAVVAQGTEGRPFALEWSGTLEADEMDVLEVDLRVPQSGSARLFWRRAGDPKGSWPAGQQQVIHVAGATDPQTLSLALMEHPGWKGRIVALRFEPLTRRSDVVVLFGLRFVRQGWVLAHGSSEETGGRGPGEMVSVKSVAMRAWPSSFGVPLFAGVVAPPGAVLEVHTAVSPRQRFAQEPVHLALDGRRPGGVWQELTSEVLARGSGSEGLRWFPLEAALGELAGGQVELRLRSWAIAGGADDSEPGTSGALESADIFWGAPVLRRPRSADARPNILLVTMDTTRAAALGAYGGPAQTPFLDELADTGAVFEGAFATTNATQPSHASLLTGTWVQDHGVINNFQVLTAANRTLAEELREAGYMTGAAVSQQHLGLEAGFGQGFDLFVEPNQKAHLDGQRTVLEARRWLEHWSTRAERPFFFWLHLFDPHTPYTPPADWLAGAPHAGGGPAPPALVDPPSMPLVDNPPLALRFLDGVSNEAHARWLYHAGVSYTDALLSRLVDGLQGSPAWERTALIVTADHGESLGERGNWYNHMGLYDEVIRVPLLVRFPAGQLRGRFAAPVSLVDIAPTLLDLVGVRPMDAARGISLLQLDGSAAGSNRRIWFQHADDLQVGCRDGEYWFFTTLSPRMRYGIDLVEDAEGRVRREHVPVALGKSFLFDLRADPGLTRDLASERPQLVERYLEELEIWRASARPVGSVGRSMSAAERSHLDAIGYSDAED